MKASFKFSFYDTHDIRIIRRFTRFPLAAIAYFSLLHQLERQQSNSRGGRVLPLCAHCTYSRVLSQYVFPRISNMPPSVGGRSQLHALPVPMINFSKRQICLQYQTTKIHNSAQTIKFYSYLVLQDINIEIGCTRILF